MKHRKTIVAPEGSKWTVLSRLPDVRKVLAICECGVTKEVRITHMKTKASLSCGCHRKLVNRKAATTHGMRETRLYKTYYNMRDRCSNPNNVHYEYYGGKGVTVCKEWDSFEPFHSWATGSGYSDDLTIDRIDGSKGYHPNNCRWVTMGVQAANKSKYRSNTSGFTGVYPADGKWIATVGCMYLGVYETPEDAVLVRDEYIIKEELYGYSTQL